jgi:hypothetical protein
MSVTLTYHLEGNGNELQDVSKQKVATGSLGTATQGLFKFDTTLNRPVWADGTAWRDYGYGTSISFSQLPTGTVGYPIVAGVGGVPGYSPLDLSGVGATGILAAGRFPALTGDLTGTAGSLSVTVATVGGASAANIADAVTKRHTQNTDTGTTSATFQIGSGGPKWKNVNGEIQLRDAADATWADLRVGRLFTELDPVQLFGNEVNIGDSNVLLNFDITAAAQNSNGGITVKRLKAPAAGTGTVVTSGVNVTGTGTSFNSYTVGDALVIGANSRVIQEITSNTTLKVTHTYPADVLVATAFSVAAQGNAVMEFNSSTNVWQVTDGAPSATTTFNVTRKFALDIPGDGSTTTFNITHNLNTVDTIVSVHEKTGQKRHVNAKVIDSSANVTQLVFNPAPASGQYRVVITG